VKKVPGQKSARQEIFARGLKEAKEELDIMKMDEDERREYEEYLESLRYQASMFESSYKIGAIKGEEKGRQEREKEIAKKMKKTGTKIEFISEITGLPQEVIENL
jgi:predicted transposase/invertase (TIGR01784 family)